MSELPSHPEAGDESIARPVRRGSRTTTGVVVAVVVVVAFVVLHLTGALGSGGHA